MQAKKDPLNSSADSARATLITHNCLLAAQLK